MIDQGPAYDKLPNDTSTSEPTRGAGPQHTFWRIYLFLTAVLGPIVCFSAVLTGFHPGLRQPWQDGSWASFVSLLLGQPGIHFLMMHALYPLAAMLYVLLFPQQSQQRWVRWGIYLGVPMSLQFLLLQFVMEGVLPLLIGGLSFILFFAPLSLVLWGLVLALKRRLTIRLLLNYTVIAAVVTMIGLVSKDELVEAFLPLATIGFLGGSGFLCPWSYLVVSLLIWDGSHAPSSRPSGVNAWLLGCCGLAGYLVTWRQAVIAAQQAYHQLPTTDPNCFVSSAAAHGHGWLVGSREINLGQRVWRVNRQMQYLKFLEFAISTACPRFHCWLRRWYNCLGPNLAKCVASNRWLADLAFLLLVPLMGLAWGMAYALAIPRENLLEIYSGDGAGEVAREDAKSRRERVG